MSSSEAHPERVRLRDLPNLIRLHRAAEERCQLMRRPDLTYLFWEATLRCNLRCRHCGSSCEATSQVRELDTADILRIVDSIAEDFDATRIFVSITGGEPLLRPDLHDVAARMAQHGMRPCIVTNGTLLTRDSARRLVDAGMHTLSISVDGLAREHEALRGRGTYRGALQAVSNAREAGFRDVEAITCVRPSTVSSLAAIEASVRAAGANLWRLITIDTMGRQAAGRDEAMWLPAPDVRRMLSFVDRRRRELARTGEPFDVQFSGGGFLGVRQELAVRHFHGQCYAGLCVASILSDGSVAACPSLPRTWAQGSALEHRFSAIWHARFRQHRETGWRRTGVCSECDWFDLCLGGGLHERIAQPAHFCWLERMND